MKRKETGDLGEKLAAEFLKERGYKVLETNYRCPRGEIDIVARQEDTLVFVEVRTKRSLRFGSPEESVTPAKMARLRAAAAHYGQARDGLPPQRRIDVVAIEMDKRGKAKRIELIENAVGGE